MKNLLLSLLALGCSSAFADTLCNVFCVKTLSETMETVMVVDITPTLYRSESNNVLQVIAKELGQHCKKISSDSRVMGTLTFNPSSGTLNVRDIENASIHAGKMNCTRI